MKIDDNAISFNLDEVESFEIDSIVDHFNDEGIYDEALEEDDVHMIGDDNLGPNDALDNNPDTMVMNMSMDENNVPDYVIADINDDGMIDVDKMLKINDQDIAGGDLSTGDNVYMLGVDEVVPPLFTPNDLEPGDGENPLFLEDESSLLDEPSYDSPEMDDNVFFNE